MIIFSRLWMCILFIECVDFFSVLLFCWVNIMVGCLCWFFNWLVIILIIFWWNVLLNSMMVFGILFLRFSEVSVFLVCCFMFCLMVLCCWLSLFSFIVIVWVCMVLLYNKYFMFVVILFSLLVVLSLGLIINFRLDVVILVVCCWVIFSIVVIFGW